MSTLGFKDWEHEIKVSGGTVSLIALPGQLFSRRSGLRPPKTILLDVKWKTLSGWIGLSTEPRGANRLAVTQVSAGAHVVSVSFTQPRRIGLTSSITLPCGRSWPNYESRYLRRPQVV